MYREIIVGYDGSDRAADALALGRQLADACRAELIVAGVVQYDPVWGGYDAHFQEADAGFRAGVEAAAGSVGGTATIVPSASPSRGLHELAERTGADLVVIGSAGHGHAGETLLGGTATALLHGAPCAVGLAPRGYAERTSAPARVVVGYDGSEESALALDAASELARRLGSKLKLTAVAEPPPLGPGRSGSAGWEVLEETVEQAMRERLDEAMQRVPEGIDADAVLTRGDPAEALSDAATPGTVLVVGSRVYGPVRRVLLGSVSRRLARTTQTPLIVTPRGMHGAHEDGPRERATVSA